MDSKLLETTSTEVKQVKATMQQMTERMDIVSKQVRSLVCLGEVSLEARLKGVLQVLPLL